VPDDILYSFRVELLPYHAEPELYDAQVLLAVRAAYGVRIDKHRILQQRLYAVLRDGGIALALLPIRRMKTWMPFLLAGVLYGVQFVDALDYTAQVFPEANYLTRHTGDISLAGYLGYPY